MPGASSGGEALFAAVLAQQPTRPLVTFYDDASGERVELSARSLANWVTKTHFLLLDELGLGVGDVAFVALPADWITVPILLGSWSAGLTISADPGAAGTAAVSFVAPATLDQAGGGADVFVVNPASMTRSFGAASGPSDSATDYVTAVRPQPDGWGTVRFAGSATDAATPTMTRGELALAAHERARQLELGDGARVLCERAWTGPSDWLDALLAPMAVGGSLVLVANADAARHERRIEQEQVTAVL